MADQKVRVSVPMLEEIFDRIEDFDFKIREVIISPRIEIYKDGKLVRLIEDSVVRRFAGSINPEYADKFITDLEEDSKTGFLEVMQKRKMQSITPKIAEEPNESK